MGVISLLTVDEVAKALKTSRQQVRKMIREKLIPAIKIRREWRVDADYLREFLDDNMVM